jgi:hypothetical protein
VRVASVERDPALQDTYNFEVEKVHSYFVGKNRAWVHNAENICGGGGFSQQLLAAARNLGVNLNEITIENGIARVRTGLTDTMPRSDIQLLLEHAASLGAKTVEVDSGYIANEKLMDFLTRFQQSSKSLFGGTVIANPTGKGDFIIKFVRQ